MRISDWSSDVCSSDLGIRNERTGREHTRRQRRQFGNALGKFLQPLMFAYRTVHARAPRTSLRIGDMQHRSEEHTSELQSLMRISYAVFCLKKKKKKQNQLHAI